MKVKQVAHLCLIGIFLVTVFFCGISVEAKPANVFDGKFIVYKRVKETQLLESPDSAYRFRLEWLDENGQVTKIENRRILPEENWLYPVDDQGYATLKAEFEGLEPGSYRLAELGTMQYSFQKGGNYSGKVRTNQNAVYFTLDEETPRASATFISRHHETGAGLWLHL